MVNLSGGAALTYANCCHYKTLFWEVTQYAIQREMAGLDMAVTPPILARAPQLCPPLVNLESSLNFSPASD